MAIMDRKYRIPIFCGILSVAFIMPCVIFFAIVDMDNELRRNWVKTECLIQNTTTSQYECPSCCYYQTMCFYSGKGVVCYPVCTQSCTIDCCNGYILLSYNNISTWLNVITEEGKSDVCKYQLDYYNSIKNITTECWYDKNNVSLVNLTKPSIGPASILIFCYAGIGGLLLLIWILIEIVISIRRCRYNQIG